MKQNAFNDEGIVVVGSVQIEYGSNATAQTTFSLIDGITK